MASTAKRERGRRERKKAATRAVIADTALRLFVEHGYDAVSVRRIATEADVAVATIFKHFPGKEALVFDEDADVEQALVAAVRRRPPDEPILDALERHIRSSRAISAPDDEDFREFLRLVEQTPALDTYWRHTWMRHSDALAAAIQAAAAGTSGELTRASATSLSRSVLDAADVARRGTDPVADLAEIFRLLRGGWAH